MRRDIRLVEPYAALNLLGIDQCRDPSSEA